MTISCCGEEMIISNGWYHCKTCQKRLIEFPHGKDCETLAQLIVEYVDEYGPTWATFQYIIHELWRQGIYEGYEPELPPEWRPNEPTSFLGSIFRGKKKKDFKGYYPEL